MNIDATYSDRSTLRDSIRRFVVNELADVSGTAARAASLDLRRDAWGRFAQRGWLGDRSEVSLVDLVVMHEELGRRCVSLPFLGFNVAASALHAAGTADADRVLADMKQGHRVVIPTWIAMACSVTPAGLAMMGVIDSRIASDFLVNEGGLRIVQRDAIGVTVTPERTNSPLDVATLTVARDTNEAAAVLAVGDATGPSTAPAEAEGRVLLAAEMMGNAGAVMEMTALYSKDRVQFGRPIGSFQAIQHKLAEMLLIRDSTVELVRRAAVVVEANPRAGRTAAVAKLAASTAARRIAFEAHQVFAGVGFMLEHPLHAHSFTLAIQEQLLGSTEYLRRATSQLNDVA